MILPDVLEPGLSVVFCGSAVGTASARAQAYYAGPGNKFWPTLHETGLTPRQLTPSEYASVAQYGIGLTDLVKSASGVDVDISFASSDADALRRRIEEYRPRLLCFNGKRAAKEYFGVRKLDYGLQRRSIGDTQVFVAPSTSAAGNRWWDASWWNQLADLVRSS